MGSRAVPLSVDGASEFSGASAPTSPALSSVSAMVSAPPLRFVATQTSPGCDDKAAAETSSGGSSNPLASPGPQAQSGAVPNVIDPDARSVGSGDPLSRSVGSVDTLLRSFGGVEALSAGEVSALAQAAHSVTPSSSQSKTAALGDLRSPPMLFSKEEEERAMKRLGEVQERQAAFVMDAIERQESSAETHMRGVMGLMENLTGQLQKVKDGIETQTRDISVLRSHEGPGTLQHLQERLESSQSAGNLKMQDAMAGSEQLRQAIAARERNWERRAGESQASLGTLRDALGAQGESLAQMGSTLREAQGKFSALWQPVDDCNRKLGQLFQEIAAQQHAQGKELQQLRGSMAVRVQCDDLRAKLEEHRRSEVQHKTMEKAWLEQKDQLQEEVCRLRKFAEARVGGNEGSSSTVPVMRQRLSTGLTMAAMHIQAEGRRQPKLLAFAVAGSIILLFLLLSSLVVLRRKPPTALLVPGQAGPQQVHVARSLPLPWLLPGGRHAKVLRVAHVGRRAKGIDRRTAVVLSNGKVRVAAHQEHSPS